MYLVELRPGKEELYRSVDELAAAIRSGDVDAHSRIFHRATSKWISITVHPQFRAIAAARESDVEATPRQEWTFLTSAADDLEPRQAGAADTPMSSAESADLPVPTSEPVSSELPAPPGTEERVSRSWRRPFTFGAAGLLLLFGAQLALSAPRPEWPGFADLAASAASEMRHRTAGAGTPGSSTVSLASTPGEWTAVAYPMPAEISSATPAAAPVAIPPAPVVRVSAAEIPLPVIGNDRDSVMAVHGLVAQYDSAYTDARERLERELQAARLRELFVPARLASPSAVAELRAKLAAASNVVLAYRAREGEIERNHQDTFAVVSRRLDWPPKAIRAWYARPSHKEPQAAVAAGEALLASVDSVLMVLTANSERYWVVRDTIVFDRAEAAADYGRLRQQIGRQVASARERQGGAAAGVMAALLRAVGTAELPVESSRS